MKPIQRYCAEATSEPHDDLPGAVAWTQPEKVVSYRGWPDSNAARVTLPAGASSELLTCVDFSSLASLLDGVIGDETVHGLGLFIHTSAHENASDVVLSWAQLTKGGTLIGTRMEDRPYGEKRVTYAGNFFQAGRRLCVFDVDPATGLPSSKWGAGSLTLEDLLDPTFGAAISFTNTHDSLARGVSVSHVALWAVLEDTALGLTVSLVDDEERMVPYPVFAHVAQSRWGQFAPRDFRVYWRVLGPDGQPWNGATILDPRPGTPSGQTRYTGRHAKGYCFGFIPRSPGTYTVQALGKRGPLVTAVASAEVTRLANERPKRYFSTATGSNADDGLTPATAWRDADYGAGQMPEGGEFVFLDGESHTPAGPLVNLVDTYLRVQGTGAPARLKLTAGVRSGFLVTSARGVVIDGFDLEDEAPDVSGSFLAFEQQSGGDPSRECAVANLTTLGDYNNVLLNSSASGREAMLFENIRHTGAAGTGAKIGGLYHSYANLLVRYGVEIVAADDHPGGNWIDRTNCFERNAFPFGFLNSLLWCHGNGGGATNTIGGFRENMCYTYLGENYGEDRVEGGINHNASGPDISIAYSSRVENNVFDGKFGTTQLSTFLGNNVGPPSFLGEAFDCRCVGNSWHAHTGDDLGGAIIKCNYWWSDARDQVVALANLWVREGENDPWDGMLEAQAAGIQNEGKIFRETTRNAYTGPDLDFEPIFQITLNDGSYGQFAFSDPTSYPAWNVQTWSTGEVMALMDWADFTSANDFAPPAGVPRTGGAEETELDTDYTGRLRNSSTWIGATGDSAVIDDSYFDPWPEVPGGGGGGGGGDQIEMQPAKREENDLVFTPASADGTTFVNTGREALLVRNSGGAVTLTIATPLEIDDLDVEDLVIPIAAGAVALLGPFPPRLYNDPDKMVRVTCSDPALVGLALVRVLVPIKGAEDPATL